MRKSKLESYEDILQALVSSPLTLDRIAYETNMNCEIVRQRLDFLARNGLIEERESRKKNLFATTEKGAAVIKTLSFERYLGKIANKVRAIDEALEVIRKFDRDQKDDTSI